MSRDSLEDTFNKTLKVHGSKGKLFTALFIRDSIILSSYEDFSIQSTLENWVDEVADLPNQIFHFLGDSRLAVLTY